MKADSKLKYIIPIIFIIIYLIPLSYLISMLPFSLLLVSKSAGLIAFLSIFTQVMLGAFRDFFKKLYNPLKVYWFHNYLGLFTLLFVMFHVFTKSFIWSNFWNVFLLNSSLAVNLGVIAFYLMSLTVITSDLKYFFKINYNYKVWHLIHALNYVLFPVVYFHALNLGTVFGSTINYYLLTGLLIIALISIIYRALKAANIIGKRINK